jgi:hypothetical protein
MAVDTDVVRRGRSESVAAPQVDTPVTEQAASLARMIAEVNEDIASYTDGIPQEVYADLQGRTAELMAFDNPELADKQGILVSVMKTAESHVKKAVPATEEKGVETEEHAPVDKGPSCCQVLAATVVGVAAIGIGAYYEFYR